MSLKVWLPLNGDLRNQGCSEVTATGSGVTVNTSGKIGSCYSFDGSDDFISLSGNTLYNIFKGGSQQFSICFWVYHNDATRAIIFGDYGLSGAIGFNVELTTSHGVRFYWNGSPDKNFNSTSYVTAQGWTHIVITYSGSILNIYRNGILSTDSWSGTLATKNKTAGQFYLGRDSRTGTTALNGHLNDFRIYDHCLSAAEIKEISQGLVLHYKLDSIGPSMGNPNLLLDGMTPTAAGNGATGVVRSIENGIQKVVADNPNSNWCTFGNHNTTLALTKGDTFTFSLMIRSPDSNKKPTVYFQSGLGYYGMQGAMSNNWSIIYYTGTWSIDNLQTNIHLGFSSAPGTYYIKYFKLEKGDSATPWAPKEGEPLSNLKYIEDSSGYGYHGEIVGSPIIQSNTGRYFASTSMNNTGTANHLELDETFPFTNPLSISCWVKSTLTTNQVIFVTPQIQFGTLNSIGYVSPTNAAGFTINTLYKTNDWNHVCAVRNGSTYSLYINGQVASQNGASNYYAHNVSKLWLFNRSTNNSYAANASISDFRIYCTALSADDILQLYHTSAKIDNKANFHTYEINEHGTNKLTKTGIMYDNMVEPFIILPDGSYWQLMLFHYVDGGRNLFTSSNATNCNDFGLYSRLKDINNFTYNGKYEFYVIQDDIEYRWTQTNQPTASSIAGLTTVSGYNNPVNGLAKASQSNTYIGYNAWWGACGCWTSYSTGGKTGIPGFGSHDANGICTRYLALYARIEKSRAKLSNLTTSAVHFIEF